MICKGDVWRSFSEFSRRNIGETQKGDLDLAYLNVDWGLFIIIRSSGSEPKEIFSF